MFNFYKRNWIGWFKEQITREKNQLTGRGTFSNRVYVCNFHPLSRVLYVVSIPRRIQDRWRGHLVWTTLSECKIRVYYWVFEKHHGRKIQHCSSRWEARRDRSRRDRSKNCAFLRMYSIIHPYFALVQGSSHLVFSPSILYPPWSIPNLSWGCR